ncbi:MULTISPECIES: RNA polymerase sigma factor [unclassified Sphingomonas]|uniref:RNA polymerase sigma factor n=1 Tax=unclassified Sphingomonas TaxID=196159 RepID=UPI000AF9AF70|nr:MULTISPECIES: sigma-70 family RNA polymerase sigma factor [unclassified Sphingomonas]
MASTSGTAPDSAACQGGVDEPALYALLHRFALSRLRDRCDSDDLVQETFLRLYAYRTRRTVEDVTAFCLAVAGNLIRDRFRQSGKRPVMVEVPVTLVCPRLRADEVLLYQERVHVLVAAIEAMPPLRREVFLRRRLDGDTIDTVAADLDLSPAAIEKHVTRARSDLRRALCRRDLWIDKGA